MASKQTEEETSQMQYEGIQTEIGCPVDGLALRFEWHTGAWQRLFDRQILLIKEDIHRARIQDKLIVYLSCPISSRGGGYSGTNVDIAMHTERTLLDKWGERFWILNPSRYQLESKEGSGLIDRYAREMGIDLEELQSQAEPIGGDYMRMWTKVLVEDGSENTAENFDAFYFIGPRDVHNFFLRDSEATLTAGIEQYFARKHATDPDFRDYFSVGNGPKWGRGDGRDAAEKAARDQWEEWRKSFFRFYALRASANFSLGSHDEWEIFRLVNAERLSRSNGDVGRLLVGYFDGVQIQPSAAEARLSAGYAVPDLSRAATGVRFVDVAGGIATLASRAQ